MKAGFVVILIVLIGVLGTHFMLENNGYVLISFRGYTVEMSVPALIFAALVSYLLVRLLIRVLRAPRQLGEKVARSRVQRSGKNTTRGLIAMSEGKLAKGERLLTKGAANSEAPVVNYLTAARTAVRTLKISSSLMLSRSQACARQPVT